MEEMKLQDSKTDQREIKLISINCLLIGLNQCVISNWFIGQMYLLVI